MDEIRHAIATQIDSDFLDSDDIPAISTLLGFCQGLVIIDQCTSTVRLVHFTLQEYLCTHPNLFDRPHSVMTEICLTYLNLPHVQELAAGSSPDQRGTPFLEYSSLYWGTHMRMELSDRAKTSALQLLNQFDSHASANVLRNSISPEFTIDPAPCRKPISALHCISYFGIVEVADIMIKMNKWDVNETDDAGMTPLIWAAKYGNGGVVGLLLQEKRIQPDQEDTNHGRTALTWAAENGNEGVVRLLLGRKDVNPDSSSKSGRTPLSWAAENGHEGVVKLLLGRGDVNPNSSDGYNRTPLLWATGKGREEMVKLLLGQEDVNPNIPDRYGQTPLLWAAGNGEEGIVKLLLGLNDVRPDSPSASGRSPLAWATKNGHEGVVKLLLEREDVNPDIPDTEYGLTPLSLAAENGHEGIVKLLLEREEVNPNSSSKSSQTPLTLAAENGHDRVVGLLWARNSRPVR